VEAVAGDDYPSICKILQNYTMKQFVLLAFFSLTAGGLIAQKNIPVTEAVTVTGAVEGELTITIAQLSALPAKPIADVVITNHTGEFRSTAKALKGVLVKDVLGAVVIKSESPKVLSEFYFTFFASDDYKVVYSWNELFNSPTGDNCYFITEKEGKKLAEMPERLLVLTPSDFRTGRRNIKGLSRIVVSRATN